jgi:phospholipase/lecithinase/hemolysin
MLLQVQGSLSSVAPFAPTSLFVVWGGPDDFMTGVSTPADILTIVGALFGSTHILVPGMPDMGLTPANYGNASAAAFSFAFDQALQANLPKGVTYFDTFGSMRLVVSNPGTFGFTDVKDPCLVGLTPCANPNQYLFGDDLMTTAADAILAAQFADAVHELSTLLMLGHRRRGISGNGAEKRSPANYCGRVNLPTAGEKLGAFSYLPTRRSQSPTLSVCVREVH